MERFELLNVTFEQKEEAKELGAKWNAYSKTWYCEEDNTELIEKFGAVAIQNKELQKLLDYADEKGFPEDERIYKKEQMLTFAKIYIDNGYYRYSKVVKGYSYTNLVETVEAEFKTNYRNYKAMDEYNYIINDLKELENAGEESLNKSKLHKTLTEKGFITFELDISDGVQVPNFLFVSETTNEKLDDVLISLGMSSKLETEDGMEWCEWCNSEGEYLIGYNNEVKSGFYFTNNTVLA